jgi:hypothetical protein
MRRDYFHICSLASRVARGAPLKAADTDARKRESAERVDSYQRGS